MSLSSVRSGILCLLALGFVVESSPVNPRQMNATCTTLNQRKSWYAATPRILFPHQGGRLTVYPPTGPLSQTSRRKPTSTRSSACVADGPFSNLTLHINQTGFATDYCLSRDLSQSSFVTAANTSYLDECFASANYSEAWQCYKKNPHGAGHAGVGGVMLDVTLSPGDPLFYLHHTYLDYAWWQWQAVDLSARLTDMTGRNVPLVDYLLVDEDYIFPISVLLESNGDPGNVTTLNHNLWMTGLVPNATIAEVMDIRGDLICAEYI